MGHYVASSVKGVYLQKSQGVKKKIVIKILERITCPAQDSIQNILFIKYILFLLVFQPGCSRNHHHKWGNSGKIMFCSFVFFPTSFLTTADYNVSEGNIATLHSLVKLSLRSFIFKENSMILEVPSDYYNFPLFCLHPLKMTMCLA